MMNKLKYLGMGLLLMAATTFTGCNEDDLNPNSIFSEETTEKNEFDLWLLENYVKPYNISFQYRYFDKETDQNYNVIPADFEKSKAIAKLVQFLWLDVYNDLMDGDKTFIRTYTPRVIQLIGSYQYNSQGSIVMGAAEQGMKVMLYGINDIDLDVPYANVDDPYRSQFEKPFDLNANYFHTMHHEFCHVLTQTKDYPKDFQTISAGAYHSTDWVNVSDKQAAKEGFVSGYASGEYNEDFAETFSTYVTLSPAGWQKIIDQAGEEGAAIINQKLDAVREYFSSTWNIDLDELRSIIIRRSTEVENLDLRTLN